MSKTAIIALGGNALSQKKQAGTIAEQFNNTRHSFEQIIEFLRLISSFFLPFFL